MIKKHLEEMFYSIIKDLGGKFITNDTGGLVLVALAIVLLAETIESTFSDISRAIRSTK